MITLYNDIDSDISTTFSIVKEVVSNENSKLNLTRHLIFKIAGECWLSEEHDKL